MALDHLLYFVYSIRVSSSHVESPSSASMGCVYHVCMVCFTHHTSFKIRLTERRGVIATCQSAAQNWSGMMALRFLLGAAEAGFGPGVPYLLSFFYSRRELGLRCGIFLSAAPLAATFAGALAYGITSGHPHIANWRLLFLVEGLPSVAFVLFAYFLLPDSPGEAKFLTEEEREVAKARSLRRSGEEIASHKIDWKDIGQTLLDPKPWFTAVCLSPFLTSTEV